MTKRRIKIAATVACLGLLVASCGESEDDDETPEAADTDENGDDDDDAEPAEDPVTLQLGHSNEPAHPNEACGSEGLNERLIEKTDGTLTIESFPSEQLGTNNEMGEQIVSGATDMVLMPVPVLAQYHAPAGVLNAIYMFESADESEAALQGELGQELWDGILEDANVRVLGQWYYGARHLTTTDIPVYSPDDLDGVSIRAIDNEVQIANVSALGGTPSPISFGELYLSLQQGVVQGQENPIATIASSGFDEVQGYLMLTGHLYPWLAVSINEDTWQGLSEEHQTALEEAINETSVDVRDCIEAEEEEFLTEWEESGAFEIIEDVDHDAFRERAGEILPEEFADTWGPDYAEIQARDWTS